MEVTAEELPVNGKNHAKNRQKRKKKNSRFLRNAKGFAKQGIYGRGSHIEDDQYNYFINILDAMKSGFEDAEEKGGHIFFCHKIIIFCIKIIMF